MRITALSLTALALALAGCGGGGGSSGQPGPAYCQSLNTGRSYIDSSCVGCVVTNAGDVADGDLFSFADVSLTDSNAEASVRAGNGGAMLPGGTRAGAFYTSRVQLNPLVQGTQLEVRTYLQGVLVESSGAQITMVNTGGGTDADYFASFGTTAPFDAVEFVATYTTVQNPSSADIRVYEICSDGHA